MEVENVIPKFFKNQAELARVIAGGKITRAKRLKAHRIWNGLRNPTDEELAFIYQATKGGIDANYFSGLPTKKKRRTT